MVLPPNVDCTDDAFSINSFSTLLIVSYLGSPSILGIVGLGKESVMFSTIVDDILYFVGWLDLI